MLLILLMTPALMFTTMKRTATDLVFVESGDGKLSWSPVKLTRTGVKAASDTKPNSDLSENAELM